MDGQPETRDEPIAPIATVLVILVFEYEIICTRRTRHEEKEIQLAVYHPLSADTPNPAL